jgi:hypothetical protein
MLAGKKAPAIASGKGQRQERKIVSPSPQIDKALSPVWRHEQR